MQLKKTYYDIAIIGGSIAGLTTAYYLLKTGLKIIILEQKKETGYPVCCGEAISKKSLDNLEFFDNSFIDTNVKGFRVFFPDKNFFYVDTEGYLINRDKFEKHIAKEIMKKGVNLLLNTKVVNIEKNENSYSVSTANKTFYAKFIVGADGPASITDNIIFKNKYILTDAVQFKIKKTDFPYHTNDYLNFYYHKLSPFYFWVFEKQNEINIGGAVKDKETLIKFIKEYFPSTGLKNAFFSRGKIPVSWIKKQIYRENCFLTGDAAGLTNPVSFAGIYSAIKSAKICAECINLYFKSYNKKYLLNYEKIIRKILYSPVVNFIAKHCYSIPEKILNFIGDYFNGSNYKKKDFFKFFKMSLKLPEIYRYLLPLIIHRQLLRYCKDKLW